LTEKPLTEKPLIIAIDGPAASGKGTLARLIAAHYDLPHLDTGLTYRAVAAAMLQQGIALDDEGAALEIANKLDLSRLDAAKLSRHEIGEAASKIAVFAPLRQCLVAAQRHFAYSHPKGAVLDGRDIGTIVLPEARSKLFITASPEIRAERRYNEIITKGGVADFAAILADLNRRDARDSARKDGALKQAADAHLLDTTNLTIEEVLALAVKVIDTKWHIVSAHESLKA